MLRKALSLPRNDQWLLIQALVLVLGIKWALHAWSFRRVKPVLDKLGVLRESARDTDNRYEGRIIWAVSAVSRRFLGDRPCLPQALAARLLLQRRGIPAELHIGVAKAGDGQLLAHAWLTRNGDVIIGGAASPFVYTPFPSLDRAGA